MTDDQGYGDLGVHGNAVIRTPTLDRLAREGVRLEGFYVSPVCTPTRACLMTGRYNQRTRAIDTYRGRAMMDPDEVTVAEILQSSGYRTGIFGKWHLGDNYPMRACDQGFETSLVHRGGGLAQPSGPPGEGYFDPELLRDGEAVQTKGYCTDIFTDGAIEFVNADDDRPWFCYIAYNCPHTPLQVPKEDEDVYRELDLSREAFPQTGYPVRRGARKQELAKLYGMVSGIDRNLGRLFSALESKGLDHNTLVIFLTDNGPQGIRYNAGFRGTKGTVYEGGIRVPCFLRWPAKLTGGKVREGLAAHIDLTPTILAACGVAVPEGHRLDGMNVLDLIADETAEWPERTLFFQWHRGDAAERYRAFAVREGRYKLVQSKGAQEGKFDADRVGYELYDIATDPYEMHDIASAHPEIVARLKQAHSDWYDDVRSTRGFDPPRIVVGTEQESPVTLTRQDWRGAGWEARSVGHWLLNVGRAGEYTITTRFPASDSERVANLRVMGVEKGTVVPAGVGEAVFEGVPLEAGDARLDATVEEGDVRIGAHYVEIARE